jgi:HSP20 family protein
MAFPSIFRGSPLRTYERSGDPLWSLDRTADRLFEDFWRGVGASATAGGAFVPRMDVEEREGEYLVTAELPGLEEKDFQLEVHGDMLTISGEKKREGGEPRGAHWSERAYGAFRRSIQLPNEVESDKASATFRNGVLTVTLPKSDAARVRQIPVTSA